MENANYADFRANHKDPKVKRVRALALLRNDDWDQAAAHARQAIDLNDDLVTTDYLIVAIAEARLDHMDDAQEAYQKAIAAWPEDLKEPGAIRVTAPEGILWIETADQLNRLRDEAGTLLSVVEGLKHVFGMDGLRLVAHGNVRIQRIAVVGGSGGGLASLAAEKGADLLITGDVGHHHALEAESLGLSLIDAGHFNTEKAAFRAFAEHLKGLADDLGWDLNIESYEDEHDPFQSGLGG